MLNKKDLLDEGSFAARRQAVLEALDWQGPVYEVSAIAGDGTRELCGDLMRYLEECRSREAADSALVAQEAEMQGRMQEEARQRIEALRAARRSRSAVDESEVDDDFDDDFDVDTEYRP